MTNSDKNSQPTAHDPRWQRIVARDKMADGQFWYSVATTGIYCRPSCPSRTPKPDNVTLHDTLESARSSGCRPCKRCNPDGCSTEAANAALIEQACRLIEMSETPPSLDELAQAVELSPGYFHRLFKAQTGLTPKSYATAHRARKVRDGLSHGSKVTDAMYDAGFNSNGRFYAQSSAMLGMTPRHYRDGGLHEVLHFAVAECSLGSVLVASSEKGVASILIGDDAEALVRDLQDRFPKAELVGADADYEQSIAKVIGFIEDPNRGLDLPLDVRGTAFQQRVWQALRQIPAGETATYAEVAQRIGQPTATRAVAGACAANHIAVAIPCHRVIRNDGSLSGYRWGVDRKRSLLLREAGTK
ncbi:bifunctional DNA-binding transcriptional regulator/O6-methylguanine-DNA methyltransferase Ada [Acetobacter pasteurianus]|uniref:bifunctional DNA-binding transcriptional regulator/O6-methylguanine-DNA methyltransferase Ada n=1 Tax=Acetobacter pasteurianus TaxID=438 RepID=UPI000384548F|nr:bifunctional DNA-binding transcriptional regulator/O6-methylguanine-DNA methyltransferase Ada [Acetobacter pasteurianus]CCT60879.1 AraC family transcriptional regulator, regulatory protein of adaptative response / methylated-DNA-[protein]-cysteine S-methyltransferase [Acetobacter pasteurianus 386B]